jgi:uncharacterized membrane protein YfcA
MIIELLVIFTALVTGGALKGATGMGIPVIAVPALAAFFGVPFAIAVLIVPVLVTNSWQAWQFRSHWPGLTFLPRLLVSAVLGILVGTWLLTTLPGNLLSLGLGLSTIVYVLLRLARPELAIGPAAARRWAAVVGAVAGALQGATGVSAPVSVTFANGMRLSRPQFVLTVSALFLAFVLTQIPALMLAGLLTWERMLYSVVALLPVAAGMPIGARLARLLSPQAFDRLILIVLVAIAMKLFWDAGLSTLFV